MAANEAIFFHGGPLMVDYTPAGQLEAGHVEEVNDSVWIVHRQILATEKGAVAARGGVYKLEADSTVAIGDIAYWDDTAKTVNDAAGATTGDKMIGYFVTAGVDGGTVLVEHAPNGTAAA